MDVRDKYWVLEGREVRRVASQEEWGLQFVGHDRQVAQESIGGVLVNTVFLGINQAWNGGPPLLFETRIFGGAHSGHTARASTWKGAEACHAEAVALVREG